MTLNKLEQQIFDEFPVGILSEEEKEYLARIAAKIAPELAEKAYNGGISSCGAAYGCQGGYREFDSFEDFKKEVL